MNKYLIRLDDACPTMDADKWQRMEDMLDRYGVRPMVGVIPLNEDLKLMRYAEDPKFWLKVKTWQNKGYTIAMHGCTHKYESCCPGINPMWNNSEFAGVPLERQKEKILRGWLYMKEKGISPPKYFFAPSHTYDHNTLIALRSCTGIRIISDTMAFEPYRDGDFVFVPLFSGHCVELPIKGVYTFCFHPNNMNENSFVNLEAFLNKHQSEFVGFDSLNLENITNNKSFKSKLLSFLYFGMRDLRGIRKHPEL